MIMKYAATEALKYTITSRHVAIIIQRQARSGEEDEAEREEWKSE